MIGFIGGGNMAEAIIRGLVEKETGIIVSDRRQERLAFLRDNYGVQTTPDNLEVCQRASLIVLAVKPQNMKEVLEEIRPAIEEGHLIVSIAAGIRLLWISEMLNTDRVIRVMPNCAALFGESMTVLSPHKGVTESDLKRVEEVFRSVGDVMVMEEEKMDTVTALSGSGPAYVAEFVESLVEAAVREGITHEDALNLVLQTLRGALRLLSEGIGTQELKRMVTSPGGTTAEALYSLDRGGFRATVKEALRAAKRRSEELSKGR